ncbi:MAG TPA: hypothetical protein VK436_15340 [Methanocella sp.]|nr:hypothetical protein [Methanocella sp.]
MDVETTFTAKEIGTVPVALVDVTAYRALLAREPGVYKYYKFSESFRLIPEELFELIETPVVQFPVEFFPMPLLHAYLAKVFESEHCISSINNRLYSGSN